SPGDGGPLREAPGRRHSPVPRDGVPAGAGRGRSPCPAVREHGRQAGPDSVVARAASPLQARVGRAFWRPHREAELTPLPAFGRPRARERAALAARRTRREIRLELEAPLRRRPET